MVYRLSCPAACGILVLGPGIEPMFPPLAGRFLTTGLPVKSFQHLLQKNRFIEVKFTYHANHLFISLVMVFSLFIDMCHEHHSKF